MSEWITGRESSDYLSLTCSSSQFHSFSAGASSYASGLHSPTRAQGMRNYGKMRVSDTTVVEPHMHVHLGVVIQRFRHGARP